LLSGIALFSLFGLPFATSTVAIPDLFSDLVYNIQDSPILMILTVLGGVLSLISIFLFKNRGLQARMSYMVSVFSILLLLTSFLLVFNECTTDAGAESISESIGIAMPVLSLIFSLFAAKFINKDEATVSSMNRLR
ncbi:MAG: DUF4293 domain-containing protein, partial [Chitinophagales bacterium]|nr:DUF4293 domain-containing protein [Chitinophagales bacterium]